jgi:membrane dipeptidase
MRLFDLHCDTLTESMKVGQTIAHFSGAVSLDKAAALEDWAQVFAVFSPDDMGPDTAWYYVNVAIDGYEAQIGSLRQGCKPLLAIENASCLAGHPERLDELARRGVRMLSLTWNGENGLGYGAMQDARKGLKPEGEAIVRRAFELGLLLDVSHLNEAGFWDACDIAGRLRRDTKRLPRILASHSCCDAVNENPRNLRDSQIRLLADLQGLIGLNLYPVHLGGDGDAAAIAAHIEHLQELGASASMAIGTDYDGAEVNPRYASIDRIPLLYRDLISLGISADTLDALFWGNAARYFNRRAVLPN